MTEMENKMCTDLWVEFEPDIRKICISRLKGNTQEVDDIIAETYLSLCRHIVKDGPLYHPRAWLYKTANNIINKKYKEKYKQNENIIDLDTEEIALPFQTDFVDDIIKNDELEQICLEIEKLSEKEKIIIKYSYFDKHKTREIAELLNSTEAAVKQKRYRIVNRLRKILRSKKFK